MGDETELQLGGFSRPVIAPSWRR